MALSQIQQPNRYEIEMEEKSSLFNVVSADEYGIVIFRENGKEGSRDKMNWEVRMLNTELEETWVRDYGVSHRSKFRGYEFRHNQLYLLFNNDKDLQILAIDLTKGDFKLHDVSNLMSLKLEEFLVVGESAIFGGSVDALPTIMIYNLNDATSKVMPGFYQKNTQLIEINIDEINNRFNVITTERESYSKSKLVISNFSKNGDLLSKNIIDVDKGLTIYSARSNYFADKIILTGNFGLPNTDLSKGVYFAKITNDYEPFIKYYNFSDLTNFFKYLPEKKEEKVKSRINERKLKGKETIITSRMLLHELIEEHGEYILLGEVYNVSFNYPLKGPYWINDFNYGNRGYYVSDNTNFDYDAGTTFSYSHAAVLAFNEFGDLLWDNSLTFDGVTTHYLNQVVNISTVQDRTVLVYNYKDEIRSKIIKAEQVIEDQISEKIKLMNEDDLLKSIDPDLGGLNYWYEDNFYTWGYQRITNDQNPEVSKKRYVFYINKVSIK